MAPKPAPFQLAVEDQSTLEKNWLRKGTLRQNLALRARTLIALSAGRSPKAVAADVGVTAATVFKWRTHYNDVSANAKCP